MLQIIAYIVFIGIALGLSKPFGKYMAKVFSGERNLLTPVMKPVENFVYRICGIDVNTEMNLKTYVFTLLGFSVVGIAFVFLILEVQGFLPLNPQGVGPMSWDLALNTAVSYVTNSNWISYVGERDLSYAAQLLGPIVQDIISPTLGLVAIVTMARCFSRSHSPTIGNFWVDMTRGILYIWVPVVLVLVFPLISQGIIQNFNPYLVAHTLDGKEQLIPGGPVGFITTFKMVAEDGMAWSASHSAHPFENPTGLSCYLEMAYILFVPPAITFMIGELTKNRKIAWALFITMSALFVLSMPLPFVGELQGNPMLQQLGVQGGVNMEGKEARFTMFEHIIWIVTAMAPANGSTIAMHDSLMPLTLFQIIMNLAIGAPIFGCIGTGSLNMMHYFIVSMFLAGLMTGRTPELIGKKLDLREVVLACVSFLAGSFTSVGFTAIAILTPAALASLGNNGPHGFTEILYVFSSTSITNGSTMAGLATNTPFYNLMTIVAMAAGKFSCLIVGLLIAGSIARKGKIAVSASSLPVASPLFIITVIFVIIILSALTFFPALTLGPILEQVMMMAGITF
jgi:K+-transporting ATPase ATPase A chain